MPEVRNAAWADATTVTLEVYVAELGDWMPFSARDQTGDDFVQSVWEAAQGVEIAPAPAVSDADRRAEWRPTAKTSRTNFCLRLKRREILTPADAILAAQGGWPESFADALAKLPAEIDADEAQIVWAATTEVHRNDPVLLALQASIGMSDEDVDDLVGWSDPSGAAA